MSGGVDPARYQALLEARVFDPESLRAALVDRTRRSLAGDDGRLLILASDHTARGKLGVGGDPLAALDRRTLLDRLVRGLAAPGVDGVLASADILEELAWLGALDGRLAIGTMNRGGIAGARWELDDRMTAYDADHIAAYGLDGGKMLLRIDDTDPGVARTIESVAAAVTRLADRRIMSLVEALPYTSDAAGRRVLDGSDERLMKVAAIASGLGSSSVHTWLKLPDSDRMAEVASATTLPVLMLGGDPGTDTEQIYRRWETSMKEPNVRGLVAGRALLYPPDGRSEHAVRRAAALVHEGDR
ncbi:MAG: deoxyribose-phosphate aldolase [Nocardioidaceae bacterium]